MIAVVEVGVVVFGRGHRSRCRRRGRRRVVVVPLLAVRALKDKFRPEHPKLWELRYKRGVLIVSRDGQSAGVTQLGTGALEQAPIRNTSVLNSK